MRRVFVACILFPLIGLISIHLLVYDVFRSAADTADVADGPPRSRTKRQDMGIGDESQLAYEARSSRRVGGNRGGEGIGAGRA